MTKNDPSPSKLMLPAHFHDVTDEKSRSGNLI